MFIEYQALANSVPADPAAQFNNLRLFGSSPAGFSHPGQDPFGGAMMMPMFSMPMVRVPFSHDMGRLIDSPWQQVPGNMGFSNPIPRTVMGGQPIPTGVMIPGI